ncbi:MAG: hypothetical protein JWQ11_3220 [Rhizobacter sp.]|nr:hypothetical protein [Rhizobacter sp.]
MKARADLQIVLDAQAARLDAARPVAVEKQRKRGRWTVREVVDGLADADTFVEYGGLAKPAMADMQGAADGLVMGTAQVGGRPVDLLLYDFTVHAGTQSAINHQKMTRMFEHALRYRLPVILWLDGGGARPHDMLLAARGKTTTFVVFAQLSGRVPTIGILPGRSFAGQANLAGMCDLLIGMKGAALGMAGPPLVEAALGIRYTPEEIGPMEVHEASGVLDLLVDGEAEAIAASRKYLAFFGPAQPAGEAPDQMAMRDIVPENPKRAYDVREVIATVADIDSMQELKPLFGTCIVTAFIRLGGRAVGVLANQPMQLAGAIDSDGSVKAARFVQLCDAFDIPLLLLCDTPGLMVGPDVERTGLVRHSARLMAAVANATIPLMTVVLRKAYGLGYYIMGSQALDPAILLAWPTAEYGGMGLEGAVNIIHKKQLEAVEDLDARAALHQRLTQALKDEHTAVVTASHFNYDDVIDPADTRELLLRTLETLPAPAPRTERKRTVEPF